MNSIPFTARLRIFPVRANGKRQELIRAREKISHMISLNLAQNFGGNIASPGGSGSWLFESPDGISNMVRIAAVTPQFGEFPESVTVVGFINPTGSNDATATLQPLTVIHANGYVDGLRAGSPGWTDSTKPSTALCDQVKELKTQLESAITSVEFEFLTLEVSGCKFGIGGHHFPQ
jgi:hypothetical protein